MSERRRYKKVSILENEKTDTLLKFDAFKSSVRMMKKNLLTRFNVFKNTIISKKAFTYKKGFMTPEFNTSSKHLKEIDFKKILKFLESSSRFIIANQNYLKSSYNKLANILKKNDAKELRFYYNYYIRSLSKAKKDVKITKIIVGKMKDKELKKQIEKVELLDEIGHHSDAVSTTTTALKSIKNDPLSRLMNRNEINKLINKLPSQLQVLYLQYCEEIDQLIELRQFTNILNKIDSAKQTGRKMFELDSTIKGTITNIIKYFMHLKDFCNGEIAKQQALNMIKDGQSLRETGKYRASLEKLEEAEKVLDAKYICDEYKDKKQIKSIRNKMNDLRVILSSINKTKQKN